MFGEECTLPMDIGLPRRQPDPPEGITSLYDVWVKDSLEVAFDQVRRHSGQAVQRQKRLYDQRAVRRLGHALLPSGEELQIGLYLDWPISNSGHPRLDGGYSETPRRAGDFYPLSGCEQDSPNPVGRNRGLRFPPPGGAPVVPMLGASTVAHTSRERVVLADVNSIIVLVDMQVCLRMISGGCR